MGDYYGWPQIAARLGVSVPTARKWHAELGLIVYKRNHRQGSPPKTRPVWYTNDQLVLAWEIARAQADRDQAGLSSRAKPEAARGR